MDEDDSQHRFSTLIAGTPADHLSGGSFIINPQKHRGSAGTHEMSPGAQGGQKAHRAFFGAGPGNQTGGASLAAPGDLVRRAHRESQRASLGDAGRMSSPFTPAEDEGARGEHRSQPSSLWQAEWGEHGDVEPTRRRHATQGEPSTASRQPREFVKLRTSKSMHQRSEGGVSRPEQHGFASHASVPQRPTAADNHHFPNARSRSASVASFSHSIQDEDISSLMMRGATDLRNAKYEIEELRRESTFLRTQLETAKSEKEELTHRVKTVKEAARQGLEAASKSLEETRTAMNSLKSQSEETFAFFVQAKAVLPDVAELRETVSQSIKGLEEVLDEDGHLVEVTKTKEILTELKTQCANSGQVSEMLREKLQSVGSDLVDAKTRVSELEDIQNADRDALRMSSVHLSEANEQIQKFADALKSRQTELHEALLASAEFEAQLAHANERVAHLEDLVKRKDSELEALEKLQAEARRLELLVTERDIQVSELQALQESYDNLTKASTDHVARIRSLGTVIEAKDGAISQLDSQIAAKESQLREFQDTLQKLQHELSGVTARLQAVECDMERKVEEIKSLEATLEATKSELLEDKTELQRRSDQIRDLEAKYQVMEERYETQLITSKCAQDTQADLQERLMTAEKTFTHDLEAATGRHKVEIAVLEQEKAALQSKVRELEAAEHAHREELITIRADYDGRVEKQEDQSRMHLELAEKRAGDLQSALDESRASVKSLEEQIASGKQEILAVRDELRDARLPDPAHKEALDALASQVTALRLENTELVLRARSIDARYRTGDLNEEEKTFINTLVQTSQLIHEQELVSKGNELRRRDNTIKEQQARIQVLEGSLAKHLKAISKPTAPPATTAENRSLIDPAAWVPSSDKGKSPPHIPDEDVTSTNVDNTATARPTPAPGRAPARPALAAVPQPDPNTKARASAARTPAGARLRPYAPAGAPTAKSSPAAPRRPASPAGLSALSSSPLVYPPPKTPAVRAPAPAGGARKGAAQGTFRRLASALSDEIQDFDDAAPARRADADSPAGTPPGERAQGSKGGPGKRERPAEGHAGSPPGGRYAKRLRTSMRSRAAVQDEPALKRVDTQQAKYKTRKRRV